MSALEYGTQPSAVASKVSKNLSLAGVGACVPLNKKNVAKRNVNGNGVLIISDCLFFN